MTLHIKIKLDDDVFERRGIAEVEDMLQKVVRKLKYEGRLPMGFTAGLLSTDGSTVGQVWIDGE